MYEYRVKKVINIVDGDTVDVEIDLGFDIAITQRVRLAGIDTPESRTKDLREKKLGLEAKEYLQKTIAAGAYKIKTEKPNSTEKYGRMLGWFYVDQQEESINDSMIKLGYAWPYDGGTKVKDLQELEDIRAKMKNSS